MKNSVSYDQIVNRLVEVFESDKLTAEYNCSGEISAMICGWAGVMSPLTRPAYVKNFGEDVVTAAEKTARRIIAEKADEWHQTNYYAHTLAADEWRAQGCPAPTVGAYIWALNSGLKGDHDKYLDELINLVEDREGDKQRHTKPLLCYIEKVVNVDNLFTVNYSAVIADNELTGGCRSEDVPEGVETCRLTAEQRKTFYAVGSVIVDNSGRWAVVDPEGFDYVRYFYSSPNYADIFKPEITAELVRIAEKKAAEELEHMAELKQHADAFETRKIELTAKYAGLNLHPETAQRARANVKKWFNMHFPGLKVELSCSKCRYYWQHADFNLSVNLPENIPDDMLNQVEDLWRQTWAGYMPTGEEGNIDYEEMDGPTYTYFEEFKVSPMRQLFGNFEFLADRLHHYAAPQDFDALKNAAKEQPESNTAETVSGAGLTIVEYSEKALALIGDTRAIKDKLKELGGRFNPRLSCGAGWIFSRRKESELKQLVNA